MPRFLFLIITILVVTGAPAAAKRSKPVACPPARYVVVEGAPLVGNSSTGAVETVVLGQKQVTLADACTAKAKIKAAKKATTIQARWKACTPLAKVVLAGRIAAPQCSELRGTLKAKKAKPRRFRALLSTCGDGAFDPGREACDAGQGCAAAEQCAATCTCVPSTGGVLVAGVVELPPGSSLSLGSLTVVAPGATPIAADGSFGFTGSATEPVLVLIGDGDGVPVLAAYTRPGQDGPVRVNARSTALALLFFASSAFTRPQADYQQARDVLGAHPAFGALASAVEARLGAAPHAIASADGQLRAAIDAAIATMSASARAPAALGGTTSVAGAGAVISRLLAEPLDDQSGISVSEADDQTGLQVTNKRRRHLLLYVRQTGFKDEQGNVQTLDRPVVGGAFPGDWIPSTNKLAGAIGSVTDVLVGNGAYQPYRSTPLGLPVLPLSAREAYYQVTVVGPGVDPGSDPVLGRQPFETGANEMLAWSFFKDIFLPFLFAGLDVHLDIDHLVDPTPLFRGFRGFVTIVGASGHVVLSLSSFEAKEVMVAIFKTIADEPAFRQVFINWFTDLVASLAPDAAQAIAGSALEGLATKINFWLALIDKALSLGDAVVAVHDMRNSDWFEEWEVTAIPIPVRLTPAVATVSKAAPAVTLTTSVTGLPNRRFLYRYATTGTHGLVCPIVGDCATTADSTFETVQYIADPLGIVEGDLDTVTVEVFEDGDGSGVIPPGATPLGKATSRIVGETVCDGPQVVVEVPSTELRAILRQRLGIAAGEPLTCGDMERLTNLGIVQRGISTLEGLQFAVNLTDLTCTQCVLNDISQLSRLRKLTSLTMNDNGIRDLTPLAGLVGLTSLSLQYNRVTDATPLAGLTNLTVLNLRGNTLNGVAALAGLTKLQQLFLRETRITSVAALAGLVNVEHLTLGFGGLETLAGLQGMTKLGRLEVNDNALEDIGALTNLNALTYLDARSNFIANIAPLAGKQALVTLDLDGNAIANLGVVDWSKLPLTTLHLRGNQIANITPLAALPSVADLDLSYNQIADATPLAGLHALRAVGIRNNKLTSIQPLVDNSGIGAGDDVNIQQNCLSESDPDITTLKNRGANVYYTPQGCTP